MHFLECEGIKRLDSFLLLKPGRNKDDKIVVYRKKKYSGMNYSPEYFSVLGSGS